MVNSKKLTEVARKSQRVASLGRRVPSGQNVSEECCTSLVADKGNLVACTLDGKRFMIPLTYPESSIFVQLFKMSEDEFGLPSDGPITLPCDAPFVEHILSLLRKRRSKAFDSLLLDSVFKRHRSPCSSHLVGRSQQAVCSF